MNFNPKFHDLDTFKLEVGAIETWIFCNIGTTKHVGVVHKLAILSKN